MHDLSEACAVLCDDGEFWRDVLLPGLQMASLRDGRSLQPMRVEPESDTALRAKPVLDALEYGPLVVVDLVDVDATVFPLIEWMARARPARVLLFRRGRVPLPFELRTLLVRSLEAVHDAAAQARLRVALGTLATHGAYRISTTAGRGTLPRQVERWIQRRERNGVAAALRSAMTCLLDQGPARRALGHGGCAGPGAPRAADLMVRSALLDRRAGRWGEARTLLEQAVRRKSPTRRWLGANWASSGSTWVEAGASDALRRAVELSGDFEATLTLAARLARKGDSAASVRLLDHALRVSGGQLNLVLPAIEARVQADARVRLSQVDPRAPRGHPGHPCAAGRSGAAGGCAVEPVRHGAGARAPGRRGGRDGHVPAGAGLPHSSLADRDL